MMKSLGALAALVITAWASAAGAQSPSGGSYFYVANTRPPDAFLYLRTHPTSRVGSRLMQMPNGTLLQVLQRQPDGWWFVRVIPSGQQGWALSGSGNMAWILCCASAPNPTNAPASSQSAPLSYPNPGSPERMAIMNALRERVGGPRIQFKVHHLAVAEAGQEAIAVADVSDASLKTDTQGTFLLKRSRGRWQALYQVDGSGGASGCKEVKAIYLEMISTAQRLGAAQTIFPSSFWKSLEELPDDLDSEDCSVAEKWPSGGE